MGLSRGPGFEMQVIAQVQERSASAIKSFTLADFAPPSLPRARPRTWADLSLVSRAFRLVKAGLLAWGIISLGAVAGMSAYYVNGALEQPIVAAARSPVIVTSASPALVATRSVGAQEPKSFASPRSEASARERLAILMDDPSPLIGPLSSPEPGEALTLKTSAPIVAAARAPRPRPEEPIVTGSIRTRPGDVRPARRRMLDPCAALRKLGAPYLFGNRCGRYTRVYPPPPRQLNSAAVPPPEKEYWPRPYQPPTVTSD